MLFLRLILSAALVTTLAACGPGFAARTFTTSNGTGAQNRDGLPYTKASGTEDLEVLKQAIDPAVAANTAFAASIESVTISRFDMAGNAVAKAPSQLAIAIQYHGSPLVTYRPTLTSTGDALNVVSKDDSGKTRLNVHCLGADCDEIEVRIAGPAKQDAGFIYRSRHVTVQALGPFAPAGASTTRLDRIGQLASSAPDALLLTTEVAWGPAFFDLRAGDVEASGDLVATGGDEENVSVQMHGETPIEGRLLGNNNHGDLLLRFADGTAWSFLRVRIPLAAPVDPGTAPAVVDNTPAGDKYIPYDLSNPVTAAFEKDRANPVIQAAITEFSTGGRSRDMKQFLNRLKPNLPTVESMLQSQAVPPEILFIMLVESSYFVSPGFPISVSKPGAVGPWQLMPETARTWGLTPMPLVHGAGGKLSANSCDPRADLQQSTLAAARYFRKLLDMFKNDPKLAIMAYNMGEYGLNNRLNCINQKKDGVSTCTKNTKPLEVADLAGLDYWTVRDLNMAPTESINYVPHFLGAMFVGREPTHYGITVSADGMPLAPALPSTCH